MQSLQVHMNKNKKEYRCDYCGKLFFKGSLEYGNIEIKCKNCKNFILINGQPQEKFACYRGEEKVLCFEDKCKNRHEGKESALK